MAVITISRQRYSLGDEIAKKVADDLGYDFIDKEKIGNALSRLGLPANQMERFDEKKPSIWDTLAIEHEKFACLMKAVIYDFAAKDNALILGRGGQALLKNVPGVLHLRIVAPFDVRLKRLMDRDGCDEKNGEKALRQKDRDSAGYIRSYYNVDWSDPDYYDLIVNTTTLSMGSVAELVRHAIHADELRSEPGERADRLGALALQHKAEAVIMEMQRQNSIHVVVTNVEYGVVTLGGTSDSETVKSDCGQAVLKIPGVRWVENKIVIVKSTYG